MSNMSCMFGHGFGFCGSKKCGTYNRLWNDPFIFARITLDQCIGQPVPLCSFTGFLLWYRTGLKNALIIQIIGNSYWQHLTTHALNVKEKLTFSYVLICPAIQSTEEKHPVPQQTSLLLWSLTWLFADLTACRIQSVQQLLTCFKPRRNYHEDDVITIIMMLGLADLAHKCQWHADSHYL